MLTRCDALIIGSGQAGSFLAARLAGAGMQVVLVEREHRGTALVNEAGMPSKTPMVGACVEHMARRASEIGVKLAGPVSVEVNTLKAQTGTAQGPTIANLTQWLAGIDGLRVIAGHARFVAPHAIEVEGETIEAPRIFINVGGRPVLPDWPGIADVSVLTPASIAGLGELPEHLIVVGGSDVGIEIARMYRRLGSRVTMLEHADRVMAHEDEDAAHDVQTILAREGVRVVLGARDVRVARVVGGAHLRVALSAAGVAHSIEASHLVAALGWRPNTDQLGLDRAGILTDAHGFITVDDELRCNVPGVWALGDVNGRGAFTHTTFNDCEIVTANLPVDEHRRMTDRVPAFALLTDLPFGREGQLPTRVRAASRPVGAMPTSRVGRANGLSETQGFMRVLVNAQTERILGAALLGSLTSVGERS